MRFSYLPNPICKQILMAPILILAGLLAEGLCGQQVPSTNCADAVAAVQLAITISNQVAKVESRTFVHCAIKNLWTNTISLFDTREPVYDFDYALIDASGTTYDLKPRIPVRPIIGSGSRRIAPGDSYDVELEIYLADRIRPGSYKLRVKRRFIALIGSRPWPACEAVSNLVSVRVE